MGLQTGVGFVLCYLSHWRHKECGLAFWIYGYLSLLLEGRKIDKLLGDCLGNGWGHPRAEGAFTQCLSSVDEEREKGLLPQ